MGIDTEGEPFREIWDYASIVGIMMYLSNNSRPIITFAVNQCAHFTHCPKDSDAIVVKRILRYLHSTTTKGTYINASQDLQVDCYVDADFAGIWWGGIRPRPYMC